MSTASPEVRGGGPRKHVPFRTVLTLERWHRRAGELPVTRASTRRAFGSASARQTSFGEGKPGAYAHVYLYVSR
eukprot:scaffold38510_cov63-Phaeocystis_antarctica.AAC.2